MAFFSVKPDMEWIHRASTPALEYEQLPQLAIKIKSAFEIPRLRHIQRQAENDPLSTI